MTLIKSEIGAKMFIEGKEVKKLYRHNMLIYEKKIGPVDQVDPRTTDSFNINFSLKGDSRNKLGDFFAVTFQLVDIIDDRLDNTHPQNFYLINPQGERVEFANFYQPSKNQAFDYTSSGFTATKESFGIWEIYSSDIEEYRLKVDGVPLEKSVKVHEYSLVEKPTPTTRNDIDTIGWVSSNEEAIAVVNGDIIDWILPAEEAVMDPNDLIPRDTPFTLTIVISNLVGNFTLEILDTEAYQAIEQYDADDEFVQLLAKEITSNGTYTISAGNWDPNWYWSDGAVQFYNYSDQEVSFTVESLIITL